MAKQQLRQPKEKVYTCPSEPWFIYSKGVQPKARLGWGRGEQGRVILKTRVGGILPQFLRSCAHPRRVQFWCCASGFWVRAGTALIICLHLKGLGGMPHKRKVITCSQLILRIWIADPRDQPIQWFFTTFFLLWVTDLSSHQIYRSDKHQVALGKSRVGTQSPTHSHPHVYWEFQKPLIYHDHLISKMVESNPTELKWHHLKLPRCWTAFGWGSTDLKKFPPLCPSASFVINTSALKTMMRMVPCAVQHVACRALFWSPWLKCCCSLGHQETF